MEKKSIEKVNKHVYKKYPAFSESSPKIKSIGDNFQLSYSTSIQMPDGKKMKSNLHVTATPSGKILKLSTSK